MVSRYARMLDGGPGGRRKPLVEHMTCRACLGHHVLPIDARLPRGYRFRAAEQRRGVVSGWPAGGDESPTHQCRDCGFVWAGPGPSSPAS